MSISMSKKAPLQIRNEISKSVALLVAVFTLDHCCLGRFAPYVGIGIGAAHLSAAKADSLQISPSESCHV